MANIQKITAFKGGRKVFGDIHYTVYYETGRKVNYYGNDTLPMTVVNFLTDENTISETVYIKDDHNHCVNSRTTYKPQEDKRMKNINMTTAQEDIEDAIRFGWIEAEETAPTEAQTTETTEEQATEETTTKEEETTMKNTKEYSFEIRQIDAWYYGEDEGWIWNTSYNMGEMQTKAQNERRAFTAWLKRHLGISFKNNRTLIEYDGDCYTIIDRKTKEPLFIAIPQY